MHGCQSNSWLMSDNMAHKEEHYLLSEAKLTEMVKSALKADMIEMTECRYG